jgi:NADPH:quinone reductase-like Zn-dependent oxidoreductase
LAQGAYAEYVSIPEDGVLALPPPDVGYEEAAPIPVGAMTALHFLREGGVGPEKRVLVNGASGSVGTPSTSGQT